MPCFSLSRRPQRRDRARSSATRLAAAIGLLAAAAGCASVSGRSGAEAPARFAADQHRVVRGDTVFALSQRYGVRKEAIRDLNRLDSNYRIHVGQRLLIPRAGDAARQAAAAPAPRAALSPARPQPTIAQPTSSPRQVSWSPPPRAELSFREPSFREPSFAERGGAAGSRRLMRPVAGRIIRPYGEVAGGRRNSGVDIAAPVGAPVVAAAEGEIAFVSDPSGPVGAVILMQHPGGMTTIYGRLTDIEVRVGQRVPRGHRLARVSARRGGEPALHFELRSDREPVNPTPFL
ncbi:MAG: M23 family metallopeptidase [Pseudomonadota bacterium]